MFAASSRRYDGKFVMAWRRINNARVQAKAANAHENTVMSLIFTADEGGA
jgi:hypothetical protein